MKDSASQIVRVRYGIAPIAIMALIAFVVSSFLPTLGVALIVVMTSPLLIAMCVRPFLIVDAAEARYVSLISNQIFASVSMNDLYRKLPSMQWFLRKSDLAHLAAFQNPDNTKI